MITIFIDRKNKLTITCKDKSIVKYIPTKEYTQSLEDIKTYVKSQGGVKKVYLLISLIYILNNIFYIIFLLKIILNIY